MGVHFSYGRPSRKPEGGGGMTEGRSAGTVRGGAKVCPGQAGARSCQSCRTREIQVAEGRIQTVQ